MREVGRRLGRDDDKLVWLLEVSSPKEGFSLARLEDLAREQDLGLVAVRREGGEELIVPSVLHWAQNHYAAIVDQDGDWFHVVDPTFGWNKWMPREVINAECSGNFLALESQLPVGWRRLTVEEAGTIFGRGYINNLRDAKDEGCKRTPATAKTPCPGCPEAKGMPVWWVSEPYVNLWLADEPVEYTTSRGERMAFRLTFKQRDTTPDGPSEEIPTTGWNHNWFSYIRWWEPLSPSFANAQQNITLFAPGGGERTYEYSTWGYADTAYNPNYEELTRTRLETMRGPSYLNWTMQSPWFVYLGTMYNFVETQSGFRLIHPDGAQDLYGYMLVLGADQNNRWGAALLTHQVDRFGNTNRFYYEQFTNGVAQYRLIQMVDYDGKTNYLRYTTNSLLREVENPYGQKANFYYDTNGFLTNIVDAAGLTNRMTYDTNGWVTSLITPYGTNTFTITAANLSTNLGNAGGHTVNRAVQSVAADGARELYLYRYDCTNLVSSSIDPWTELPQNTPLGSLDDGTGGTNQFGGINFRNSFYWNPKQAAALSDNSWTNLVNLNTNEYRVARMRHWLQDQDALFVSGDLSLEREASPDGVTEGQKTFYDYLGKPSGLSSIASKTNLPVVIARRFPNGETQYSWTRYNAAGYPTNIVTTYARSDGTLLTRTNVFDYTSNVTTRIFYHRTASQTNLPCSPPTSSTRPIFSNK